MTALRPGPAAGIGGHVKQKMTASEIQFEWAFSETIRKYANCLDDEEAISLAQSMVHSNLIEPTASLICKYSGVEYEGKYNLLTGPSILVGDDHGKVMEETMYESFWRHVCD